MPFLVKEALVYVIQEEMGRSNRTALTGVKFHDSATAYFGDNSFSEKMIYIFVLSAAC